MENTKYCTKCNRNLPFSAFAKKVTHVDGLQFNCRECCAAYAALWRAKNLERKREMDRVYARENAEAARAKTRAWAAANPGRKKASDSEYQAKNKTKIREQGKAYRKKNIEKIRENKRAYAAANREKLKTKRIAVYYANAEANRAAAREWAKNNPEKRTAQRALRRARKIKATPTWAQLWMIEEFYRYARHLTETTGIEHHVDHIVPLRSKKVCGLHCEFNLQVLPATANLKKRNHFEVG